MPFCPPEAVELAGPAAVRSLEDLLSNVAAPAGGAPGAVSDALRGAVSAGRGPGSAWAWTLHEDRSGALAAVGVAVRLPDRWRLEIARGDRGGDQEGLRALVGAVVSHVAARGGGPVEWLVPYAGPGTDAPASDLGFRVARELLQMRGPLPLGEEARRGAPQVALRPFVVGADEDAWLAANNRAFIDDPDQGSWDRATLEDREGEPWFDPEGFLVLAGNGDVRGACWTKIHAATRPVLGEIYVIFVDPAFQGRGWGRALTVAGFDWLAGKGVPTGMLYVDAANTAAVKLYRRLGLSVHHSDRVYRAMVPGAPPAVREQP